MLAPHLAEAEVDGRPNVRIHRLTLDRDKQAALETLAREQTKLMGAKLSSRHPRRRSHDRRDHRARRLLGLSRPGPARRHRHDGAVRSPGSTLKPVIYGLAFEAGLAHPETLIEDRPTRFGSYSPEELRRDLPRHGDDPRGARRCRSTFRRARSRCCRADAASRAVPGCGVCLQPAGRAPSRRSPSHSVALE